MAPITMAWLSAAATPFCRPEQDPFQASSEHSLQRLMDQVASPAQQPMAMLGQARPSPLE
jgi:hypothetical protein